MTETRTRWDDGDDIRPEPGTDESRCPDLMPSASGKPWLGALGRPYRCELGTGHGGSVHAGCGATWANRKAGR